MKKETNRRLIFSWRRQTPKINLRIISFVCAMVIGAASNAAAEVVRIGPEIRNAHGQGNSISRSVSQLIAQENKKLQQVSREFSDCSEIVKGPLNKAGPRDSLRETWSVIQTIQVECWALMQTSTGYRITDARMSDKITPEMISGIVKYVAKLEESDEDWARLLMSFPGGVTVCSTMWRCNLSLPDGIYPPEQALDLSLILATRDERFVKVTQLVYGRSGVVYGIRWRSGVGDGEVVAIFPDILQ